MARSRRQDQVQVQVHRRRDLVRDHLDLFPARDRPDQDGAGVEGGADPPGSAGAPCGSL